MKIETKQETTKVVVESVITGRKCDICGKDILPINIYSVDQYNYFLITTHHHDWGNDSVDSYEYYDVCSPECVMAFANKYIRDSYDEVINSREIEVKHVRTLEEGRDE